jgi:hypothetical protein
MTNDADTRPAGRSSDDPLPSGNGARSSLPPPPAPERVKTFDLRDDFQTKLLACMLAHPFEFAYIADAIKPAHFSGVQPTLAARCMIEHMLKYGRWPAWDSLEQLLDDENKQLPEAELGLAHDYVAKLREADTDDWQYVKDRFAKWLRERALVNAIIVSAHRIQDDDIPPDGFSNLFAEAMEVAQDLDDDHVMDWDKLLAFDSKNDPNNLIGERFLCRTAAGVIVAASGSGKSVLGLQLGVCAALGRPLFGKLKIPAPLRTLYVQSEDDQGDVAEAAQGSVGNYAITDDEIEQIKDRLRIVRWHDCAGDAFLMRLRREFDKWPYDLVIINPLISFCGCNPSDAKELSPFLRNALNPLLNKTKSGCVIFSHTNKLPQTMEKKATDSDEDLRYAGAGAAELTNFCRFYAVIKRVPGAAGVHRITFAKRGERAGLVDADGKPTTRMYIEHSPHSLFWRPSDYQPEKGGGRFKQKFDLGAALRVYDTKLSWAQNEVVIADDQGLSDRAVRYHKAAIEGGSA